MEVAREEPYDKYFVVNVSEVGARRTLCPYKVEEAITKAIGGKAKSIKGLNRDAVLVEVINRKESEAIRKMTEVCGKACTVQAHKFFNGGKGMIYLYNTDITDLDSFLGGLKEEYGVTRVEKASWIKSRDGRATAFLLTFGDDRVPEYVKITGEYALSKVYEYKERPLQCAKCQQYGHALKRCSARNHTCRKCAGPHPSWECESSEVKCSNCGEEHTASHYTCAERQREIKIIDIQQAVKVGKRSARMILEGDNVQEAERVEREKFYKIAVRERDRRAVCPFKVERVLKEKYGIHRNCITTNRNGFVVKTAVEGIMALKEIRGISCEVTEHEGYNKAKGLIYVRDYDCNDKTSFREGLKNGHANIVSVEEAKFIKPKNQFCTPFVITFNEIKVPSTISIPGEQSQTIVYAYRNKPLFAYYVWSMCIQEQDVVIWRGAGGAQETIPWSSAKQHRCVAIVRNSI